MVVKGLGEMQNDSLVSRAGRSRYEQLSVNEFSQAVVFRECNIFG